MYRYYLMDYLTTNELINVFKRSLACWLLPIIDYIAIIDSKDTLKYDNKFSNAFAP